MARFLVSLPTQQMTRLPLPHLGKCHGLLPKQRKCRQKIGHNHLLQRRRPAGNLQRRIGTKQERIKHLSFHRKIGARRLIVRRLNRPMINRPASASQNRRIGARSQTNRVRFAPPQNPTGILTAVGNYEFSFD